MNRGAKDWCGGLKRRVGCRVRRGEPLSAHTTFGVGGRAELMAWLENAEALLEARRYLDSAGVVSRILGGGSNVLVSDSGVSGATLKLCGELARLSLLEVRGRELLIEAGGGTALPRLLDWSRGHGGGGLEGLVGIPGTVGGAVKLNAGGRLGTVGDRLVEVCLLDGGRIRWVPAGSLKLGYRRSAVGSRRVVLAARFRLPRMDPERVRRRYGDAWRRRADTQPTQVRSAGSFFQNPRGAPAGMLIERAGCKGIREGRAFVSEKHANFIVHRGGASAREIYVLSRRVARRVFSAWGISLRREVELWGNFGRSR